MGLPWNGFRLHRLRVGYSTCDMHNFNQQKKTLLKRTGKAGFDLYDCRRRVTWKKGVALKRISEVMPSRFWCEVIMVFAINVRGICYFAENEIINAARYFGFLKRLMDRWHGNREQSACLIPTPHRIPILQLLSGWCKGISIVGFNPFILSA